jgi:uncharacterized protein (TIGR02466 family)
MNSVEIFSLFPMPICKIQLDRELTKKEFEILVNLPTYNNAGNKTSIDKNILKNEELTDFKNFILEGVNSCFHKIYQPKSNLELYITQSWVNYTKTGEHHHLHSHSNSFLSGVFYINTSTNDKILFSKPQLYVETFSIKTENHNLWNSGTWWIPAEKNSLLIFPSSLHHSVTEIEEKNHTRISLSFNTFFNGELGAEEELNYLKL